MVSRRKVRGWIALLLPLMLLRAVLPPGYMPVANDGGLRIVMCSVGLQLNSDAGANGDHGQAADDGSCLFAHAAAFAPPSVAPCCPLAPSSRSFDLLPTAELPPATGPPRATGARAPPTFS